MGANDKDLQHNRNYTRGPQLLEKHFTANGAGCGSTISGAAEAEQVIGDQADLLLAPPSFSMPSISFTTGQQSTTRRWPNEAVMVICHIDRDLESWPYPMASTKPN